MGNVDLSVFNQVDDSVVEKYSKLSNFEVAAILLDLAAKNKLGNPVINAGRGNPNWTNTTGRLAFARLIELAVNESKRTFTRDNEAMAGYILKDGIYNRFMSALTETPIDKFLREAMGYCLTNFDVNSNDDFIYDLLDSTLGDHYPVPSRVLKSVEPIILAYLQKNCFKKELINSTDVFPTEGGTAAMVYIFQELKQSHILNSGDTIAINSPIFTPYLQIPALKEYNMNIKQLVADEKNDWQLTDDQLNALKDHKIKAFFAVNPMNPPARAFNKHVLAKLKEVVKENPNLVIITDDVYGTFSPGYESIYSAVPHNTLLVYSFSKLYGVTGHRLGVIAANKENVFDNIIKKNTLDEKINAEYEKRYNLVVPDVDKMKFIDRMVADSRAIGLYHTSGLSTPQQVQMAMFALTNLLTDSVDSYTAMSKKVTDNRYRAFWNSLGISRNINNLNSEYYTLVSIYGLMTEIHGEGFTQWYRENYNCMHFEYRLAVEYGSVVMDTVAFGSNEGYVRVSLANLVTQDYRKLAKNIRSLIDEFYAKYTLEE